MTVPIRAPSTPPQSKILVWRLSALPRGLGLDWHRDGADVQARLPLLSAYLGHVDPKSS